MIIAVYPVVRDDETFDELIESYPDAVLAIIGGDVDLTSGPGFLNAELFSFVLPVLMAAVTIATGAALVAGEEESGTLGMILAQPINRRRVLGESALVVGVTGLVPGVAVAAVIAVLGPFVELDLATADMVAAVASVVVLAVLYGTLALAVGAVAGRRSVAIDAGVIALAGGYLAEVLGSFAAWAEPLREASPFHHLIASQPVVRGLPVTAVIVFGALTAVLAVVGAVALDRRDIG